MKLKKKVIKRKTRRKKSQYFGKDAHLAIVEYQNAADRKERSKIYDDKIKKSFDKLAENLIFIHGFSSDKEHFRILKSDCVSFLYEILEKFDPARGSKAFSYFNVCAKNFLIIQSKKRTKNKIRHVSIDDEYGLSSNEKKIIEHSQVLKSQEDIAIYHEDKKLLLELLQEIMKKISNPNEIQCLNAIITLFKKIDDLDFLNKRAIFVYLRELSGLNAKQLSVAMSSIRKHYKDLSKNNEEFILFATI
tara:strand:+ start:1754 stop:2494 length:741 start_codon:yes stop_codon:yes gene_type:complete